MRIERSGGVLVEALEIADTPGRRLRGLLGRDRLPRGRGLLLRPCSSIHTCFMRFPIDVVFLDAGQRVLRIVPGLRPYRAASCVGKAAAVLELAAGAAAAAGLQTGDRLSAEAGWPEAAPPGSTSRAPADVRS